MYAILKTGGKQYKVSEGDVIYVEKLGVEDGATVTFDEVLAVGEGDKLTVGAPYVSGAAVTGTVEKTGKGKKINIFKMKPKKGYRRRQGHRQPYTKVTIASPCSEKVTFVTALRLDGRDGYLGEIGRAHV